MANLYSGEKEFSGYKTLTELTGLTFESNKTYMVQVVPSYPYFYVREGSIGKGFICDEIKPFPWKYDGENMLYIYYEYGKTIYLNVSD